MTLKIALYTPIHKGQRKWLADMVVRAGRTDFTDSSQTEALASELATFTKHLAEHARLKSC